MSRKSKGRQKLEMVKIPKESNLLVTFSKRRYGVFKKASELATLCGAEITMIIFTPSKKVFSFGHPSVETVIDRFFTGNPPPPTSGALQLIKAHRNARIHDLNMKLTQIMTQLEMEKKRGEELEQLRKVSEGQRWWESPIEELDLPKLEELKASLKVLRQNAGKQAEQLLMQTTNHSQFYTPKPPTAALPFDPNTNGFNSNMSSAAHNYNLGFPSGNGLF